MWAFNLFLIGLSHLLHYFCVCACVTESEIGILLCLWLTQSSSLWFVPCVYICLRLYDLSGSHVATSLIGQSDAEGNGSGTVTGPGEFSPLPSISCHDCCTVYKFLYTQSSWLVEIVRGSETLWCWQMTRDSWKLVINKKP